MQTSKCKKKKSLRDICLDIFGLLIFIFDFWILIFAFD